MVRSRKVAWPGLFVDVERSLLDSASGVSRRVAELVAFKRGTVEAVALSLEDVSDVASSC